MCLTRLGFYLLRAFSYSDVLGEVFLLIACGHQLTKCLVQNLQIYCVIYKDLTRS